MMALIFSFFQLRELLELSQIIEWNEKSCNVEFTRKRQGAAVGNFHMQGVPKLTHILLKFNSEVKKPSKKGARKM